MKKLLFGAIVFWVSVLGYSAMITVDDDGPADCNNIQAAINLAVNGDVISVEDGIYTGAGNQDIEFLGKTITVKSKNGPTHCIVDCQGSLEEEHCGFLVNGASVLEGFTIAGAFTTEAEGSETAVGGAVTCSVGTIIRNCIFHGNYSRYCSASVLGLGNCSPEGPRVVNCTFYNNICDFGSSAIGFKAGFGSEMVVANCVSWGNTVPEFYTLTYAKCGNGLIAVNWSILQVDSYPPDEIQLNDCIIADPEFANPNNGDFHLKSYDGRWDPVSEGWVVDAVHSSGIDAGDPSDPNWMNELWPHGGRINMGAYGGTVQASMSQSAFGNTADLNHDDAVDLADLLRWTDDWLDERTLLDSDFDRDNDVDLYDLGIFSNNWLWPD